VIFFKLKICSRLLVIGHDAGGHVASNFVRSFPTEAALLLIGKVFDDELG
jgi:hypothetical protein